MPFPELTAHLASRFAKLALAGINREFPNSLGHVLNDARDLRTPCELHPAFYGCYDWHSSVHSHWMLVRLLRLLKLPEDEEIRAALSQTLTAENIRQEAAYFHQPSRQSFERMYGWAWLLKLAEELHTAEDPDLQRWAHNLKALEATIVDRYQTFLPKQTYPIRVGTHTNTAFGLSFALDYARTVENKTLEDLVATTSRRYFLADTNYPTLLEPGGADFFSPTLIEADLMRRILHPAEFEDWFEAFLPRISEESSLLTPAIVADRHDPQIAHLDGLNLSRAWCLKRIANVLPIGDKETLLVQSAEEHAKQGLDHVATGDYLGEHWLASFAVHLLTSA
jgi:hypothetical protein